MLKKILIAVAAIIGGFLIFVSTRPSESTVSREITIHAPVDKVFPYVNTRTLANSWNPWLKMDKEAKITTEGPEVGVGAKTIWDGGKDLGTGSATVIESVPNERVTVQLDYLKPFQMTQNAVYLVKSNGETTTVTWLVTGKNSFLQKIFCVFMDMDKMVGQTFAEGLSELKTMVEAAK